MSKQKKRQRALQNRPEVHQTPPLPDPIQAMLAQGQFSLSTEVTRQIPDPGEMERYNAIVPGSAERFLAEWEAERKHDRAMEEIRHDALKGEIAAVARDRRIGLWMGFFLAAGGLAGLVYMGLHGASWVGMAAVVGALGGLVWAVRRSSADAVGQVMVEAEDETDD